MFQSWLGNFLLTIDKLRLKCITLLALTTMMRPLDAAPMSVVWDSDTQDYKAMLLSTKNVAFHDDGSITMIFQGIKNGYDRQGFEVNLLQRWLVCVQSEH